MSWTAVPAMVLIAAGVFFFAAGSIGLLRFPDVLCRLHALTKADNLGLGLVVLGMMLLSADPLRAAKLLIVWLLVLFSSATACYLIASLAHRAGAPPEDAGT